MPDLKDDQKFVSVDKSHQDWVNNQWRPLMGWLYAAICAFDFIIAPILWAIILAASGKPVTEWVPLTLQGAGLFHLSMGAILGITSYGRSQEKISSMNLEMTYSNPSIAARKMAAARKKEKIEEDDSEK